jgi:hypothetical protein
MRFRRWNLSSHLVCINLAVSFLNAMQTYAATEPVAVRVLEVEESRHLDVGNSAERHVSHSTGLKLTLELSGAPIETATGCGVLKLEKAVDDRGNSLLGDPGSLQRSNLATFEKINREQMWFFADVKPKDKIKVEIVLNPATRSAATLKVLTGSIRVGRSTDITFADLAAKVGKPLEDKALADAKVSLTLTKVSDKGNADVSYTMSDPNGYVADVRLVDASGKDVTRGRSSMRFGNMSSYTVQAGTGPTPAGVKLVVALMTPATVLTVPIDLKDVPLP